MMRARLLPLLIASNLFIAHTAQADYFSSVGTHTMSYDLDNWTVGIPATAGASSGWWTDAGSVSVEIKPSSTTGSFVTLQVDGTLVGENTYATSNPGVGIKYKTSISYITNTGGNGETAPDFRFDLGIETGVVSSSFLHVQYQLVRLTDKVPAGKITSLPQVTAIFHNPDGLGEAVISRLIYTSTAATQPKYNACEIVAPTEIQLAPLYGNTLQNGAQGSQQAETIQLTNCPGAINGITYNFSAVYGTHNASNGVVNTVTGTGYAQNVYIQVQNADGTPHQVNTAIPLSNYDGSGDYTLPDFKVAYFIDDANSVRAGNVKSAIELKVTYN